MSGGGMQMLSQGMNVAAAGANFMFAKRAAKDDIASQADYNNRAQQELTRQQLENNSAAADAKSDRVLQAERELALLRVTNADRGAGATMSMRQVLDLGKIEGTDLNRIERSRVSGEAGLQAEKIATATNARNASKAASNKFKSAATSSFFQAAGSGVQIYADQTYREDMLAAARNKKR